MNYYTTINAIEVVFWIRAKSYSIMVKFSQIKSILLEDNSCVIKIRYTDNSTDEITMNSYEDAKATVTQMQAEIAKAFTGNVVKFNK